MKDHLLSLVTDEEGAQVTIHLDLAGVNYLLAELNNIKENLEKNDCPHTHLLSSDWGGSELTTSKLSSQKEEVNSIHHLKVYGWNEEWKKKHNLV